MRALLALLIGALALPVQAQSPAPPAYDAAARESAQ